MGLKKNNNFSEEPMELSKLKISVEEVIEEDICSTVKEER